MARVILPVGLKSSDEVLSEAFAKLGCGRLGGVSSNGWSRISNFQRCPYRYYLIHECNKAGLLVGGEATYLATGSFIHALLAVHYARLLDPGYPGYQENTPTPEQLLEALQSCGAEPMALAQADVLWSSYLERWGDDGWRPMAVEVGVGTNDLHTSRYDLVFYVEDGIHDGIWIGEHKGLSPKTDQEDYSFDGEVLGEMLSWRLSKLDDVFGELQGVCINALIKKPIMRGGHVTGITPMYNRLWLRRNDALVDQFARDRMHWQGMLNFYKKQNLWPKANHGCQGRFERCMFWDHCSTLDPSLLKGSNR